MKRTIDLTNVMKNVKTNLIPIIDSITTEGFNDEAEATFLEKIEGYFNEASAGELENYLAMAIGEKVLDSIGDIAKKEN